MECRCQWGNTTADKASGIERQGEMSQPKGGSSHCTFRKEGCRPVMIPKHEPIKKVYVEMVKEVIESEVDADDAE